MNHNQNIEDLRHSAAHLLAAAVLKLYPDAKPAIGPSIDTGFYYDFDFVEPISDADLPKIEKTMNQIVGEWQGFEKQSVSADEAKQMFPNNQYKHELIDEFVSESKDITLYKSGNFIDLCRGGHVENPNQELKYFKLLSLAGAYWRGDEKNKMLTRIYGTAFFTQEELDTHLYNLEEAKKRDHRKLGQQLEIYHLDEQIGPGLPIWLPNGTIIKDELEDWAKETEAKWGYVRVSTPVITKSQLFYTSGHLPLYKDSMYSPIDIDGEEYYIKPMNCPFHHRVFSARSRSYRELPLRLAEYGLCHRYEESGTLMGLMRVRSMQMNDAHIYCTMDQAVEEFVKVIKLHEYYYQLLGIKNYRMDLSLRDPNKMDKYHGDEKDWQLAEKLTIEAMEKSGVPYKVVNEGAAFYGPKMDFQITSSIGREFSASTNQLDLYMGKRFGLQYASDTGDLKTPVIIHRAPLGTHERFIGFLIEHFAGAFPVWLHPIQAVIIPIGEKHSDAANSLKAKLIEEGIRVEVWSDESLSKRIRRSEQQKAPYIIVIGDKEVENHQISIRTRGKIDLGSMEIPLFIDRIKQKIHSKALDL